MKRSMSFLFKSLAGILLVSTPQVGCADGHENPLKDASFELELAPEEGGWTLFKDGMYSSKEARSGSQSMFNWGFSRTVPFPPFLVGAVSGSYQEIAAEPGSRWRLTGFGMSPAALKGTPAFGILQVSFFNARGKDLGTVETAESRITRAKTSNEVNSQTSAGEWVALDTGIVTAPAGTATVQVFTLYADFSDSNISQGVYFDDLSLCALEEGDVDGSSCKPVD